MIVLTVLSILWIAYELGKEDGKWGLLIAIGIFLAILYLLTSFK